MSVPGSPSAWRPPVAPIARARTEDDRHSNFDILRVAAALAVLVSHAFPLTGRQEPWLPGIGSYGGLGVDIFFVISGYWIVRSWDRDPRLRAFLVKRALRIYPAFAVVVLLTAFALGPVATQLPLTAYFTHEDMRGYLNNLRFATRYGLPFVFGDLPVVGIVNGPLWTLPVEVGMYLSVATVGVLAGRYLWCVAVAAVPILVTVTLASGGGVRDVTNLAAFFSSGAAIAALRLDRRLTPAVLALLGLALVVSSVREGLFTVVLWVALPAFIIALGQSHSRLGAWISRHGDYSYGLYLYAFPVQQTVVWLGLELRFAMDIAIVFFVTLALAMVSWHLIEKPCLARKPRPTHADPAP